MQFNNHDHGVRYVEVVITGQMYVVKRRTLLILLVMPNEEKAKRTIETQITLVDATTQTLLGVEIKIRAKVRINVGPKKCSGVPTTSSMRET